MYIRFTQFLFTITVLLSVNVNAQINRANTKKLNPYRSNYQRMSTGSSADYSFEIREGTLWAWGSNNQGQLGDGSKTNRKNAVQIGTESNWVCVAEGNRHTLGLKTDGTVWSWGQNSHGQLGDNTNKSHFMPLMIEGNNNNYTSIAAGENHSLAIKADGTLWAWGYNDFGQLGDGSFIDKKIPVQIGTDNNWVSIAAGSNHSLALKGDGTLWTWGNNNKGQLGDASLLVRNIPAKIGNNRGWVNISAGMNHSLALKADGTLWTWGDNNKGQLGDGTKLDKNIPAKIGNDSNWVNISGGGIHSIALKANGTLWVWGANGSGQLGIGNFIDQKLPIQLGLGNNWVSIAAGDIHSLASKSDGTLLAWGNNSFGQVGDGTNATRTIPVSIHTESDSWLSLATGFSYSLGVKSNGTLWAWGFNDHGQLGDGTTTDQPIPTQIGTDNNWVCVAANGDSASSYGLKSDGTLWAWGSNRYGKLGDGSGTEQHSPVQVGTDNNWVSVAPGINHCLGLKANGTLWAWGHNSTGQVGNNTIGPDVLAPVQIISVIPQYPGREPENDHEWVSIAGGWENSHALKANGMRYGWGENNSFELGEGSPLTYIFPIIIPRDSNWVKIGPTEAGGYGLKSDGTLYKWGIIPSQEGTDNDWISIAVGQDHNLSIKANGTLYAVGGNTNGELGDGTTSTISNLVQIGTDNNWVKISTLFSHTLGLKSEYNQICGTGTNTYGELGDHTLISRTIFECYPPSALMARMAAEENELLNTSNLLTVYPNPSNGVFTIQSKSEGTFTILDGLGQPVQVINLNGSNDYSIRIENLKNGIYFIVGYNNSKRINQKVIIDK